MLSNLSAHLRGRSSRSSSDHTLSQGVVDVENAASTPTKSLNHGEKEMQEPNREESLRVFDTTIHKALTDELFWYQEFRLGGSSEPFDLSETDTFVNSQVKLRECFAKSRQSTPAQLQLCILSTTPVPPETLNWIRRLTATTIGKLDVITSYPRQAIANEIKEQWNGLSPCACKTLKRPSQLLKVERLSLPEYRRQFVAHTVVDCKCKTYKVSPIVNSYDRRPQKDYDAQFSIFKARAANNVFVNDLHIELPSKGRALHSAVGEALNTQCSRIFTHETASFSFTWQRAAPVYVGGFDTFLWERHSSPPACDYAEVFYQDDTVSKSSPRRVLMTLSTTPEWLGTTSLIGDIRWRLREDDDASHPLWPFMKEIALDPQSPGYLLLPLLAIFEQIVLDTKTFLEQASNEILKISFAGRSASSIEKIQYLCHLDDCRKSSMYGLEHCSTVVRDLIELRQAATPDGDKLLSFLVAKKEDLDYLSEALDSSLKTGIMEVSTEIKQHRDLETSRMTTILTYIATVFVPFSFLTGVLSMQVTDPAYFFHPSSKPQPSDSSTTTSAAVAARAIANTTSSIIASITSTPTDTNGLLASLLAEESVVATLTSENGSPTAPLDINGAHVWPFGLFLGLAIFLFFSSLILPLVGPNILRILVQRSYKIRAYTVFWPILFFIYYGVVYWAIPESIMAWLGCGHVGGASSTTEPGGWCNAWYTKPNIEALTGYGYFYVENFDHGTNNPINTITFIVSAVVMGSIALVNIVLAIMYRRGVIVMGVWGLFAATIITVYFLDWYYPTEQYYSFAIGSGLSISAVVPLAYLAVVWGVGYFLERRAEKIAGLEKEEKVHLE